MRFCTTHRASRWSWLFSAVLCIGVMVSGRAVEAEGFRPPEECKAYTGDAHLNCLYAYIEMQKDKLTKFDDELRTQKGALAQLRDQVDRQASMTDDLQRRMAERPNGASPTPPVYTYPPVVGGFYGYPPMIGAYPYPAPGFSFYVGPRFYYGPPYYFYHHRFFGPRGHRR